MYYIKKKVCVEFKSKLYTLLCQGNLNVRYVFLKCKEMTYITLHKGNLYMKTTFILKVRSMRSLATEIVKSFQLMVNWGVMPWDSWCTVIGADCMNEQDNSDTCMNVCQF